MNSVLTSVKPPAPAGLHEKAPKSPTYLSFSTCFTREVFAGLSLDDPPAPAWRIRSDGGAFDQMTGASITSRSVVKAVKETLVYFDENRADVFARIADNE